MTPSCAAARPVNSQSADGENSANARRAQPLELVVNTTRSGVGTSDYGRGRSPIILGASTPDAPGWEQKIWYPGDRVPSRVLFRIPGAMKHLAVN